MQLVVRPDDVTFGLVLCLVFSQILKLSVVALDKYPMIMLFNTNKLAFKHLRCVARSFQTSSCTQAKQLHTIHHNLEMVER